MIYYKNRKINKKNKTIIAFCIAACLILAGSIIGGIHMYAENVNRIISVGETIKLNKGHGNYKWHSKNQKIASVSRDGKVKGKKPGKAVITAKNGKNKVFKYSITVVKLSDTSIKIYENECSKLKVKGASNIQWGSSNEKIAVVDNGKVTGRSEGTAEIYAKIKSKTLKCKVTVSGKKETVKSSISNNKETKEDLKISYIDVGQADCTLLQCNGKNMLVDAGNADDYETIDEYLKQSGVKKLDMVVLSHAHEDHIGSFQYLVHTYKIGTLYMNKMAADTSSTVYKNTMSAVTENNITVKNPVPGDRISFGSASITIVGPVEFSKEDENVNSIAFVLTYGNNRFFFGGDTTQEGETGIREAGYFLSDIDVYKVNHHGSSYSTSYAFVREMIGRKNGDSLKKTPFYAVISVGNNNSYGHPHQQTIERLEQAGAFIFRTDQQGTIVCISDGKKVSFNNKDKNKGNADNDSETETNEVFIGNINSKIVHQADCTSLPSEKNRIYFKSVVSALGAGYKKCSICFK